jgi:serine/threonine-protein kinase HipA
MTPSREEQFRVYLHDRLIGHLHRRDDLTRFVFASDYWSDPNRAVLGLRFEENPRERHRANMRLPPWFSNLLPEGRLRDWIADADKISVKREMELLAQVGYDLPGAVRVLPQVFDVGPRRPTCGSGRWRGWRLDTQDAGPQLSIGPAKRAGDDDSCRCGRY